MGALVAITKWSKAINLTNEQQALGAETVASLPAFWQWALTRDGAHPALERELLAAQDNHGAVVMELLLVAWLADIGVVITDADVIGVKGRRRTLGGGCRYPTPRAASAMGGGVEHARPSTGH